MMYEGDSREVLKQFKDNSFDSIVTDPPYELAFMGKRWDASGIAYDVELWRECLRVLKPGGHLLAFGGTRTYHRMTCAIEDAGFEIRDSIHWVYGSGFPKSMDISKQLDKMAGAEREIIGERPDWVKRRNKDTCKGDGFDGGWDSNGVGIITAPSTEAAKTWEGWGTALKPAHEPIVVARKPLAEKTVVANVLRWGTGGINIDECRVGIEGPGRFPANLIHDGSEEVLAEFAKAGERKSGGRIRHADETNISPSGWKTSNRTEMVIKGDTGTADRYFKLCVQDIPSFIYQAKASKKERGGSAHPTIKPLSLISYLVRMVTPPGGIVLDPFLGSGTLGLAAEAEGMRWIGIDLDLTEARKRIKC